MNDFEIYKNAPENATPAELAAYLDEACGDDAELRIRAVVDRFGRTRWVVVREWEPGVVVVAPSEPAIGLCCCFVVKPGSYSWPEDAAEN